MPVLVVPIGIPRKAGKKVSFTTAQKAPISVVDPATGNTLAIDEYAPFTTTGLGVIVREGDVLFVTAALDENGVPKTGTGTVRVNLPDGRAGTVNYSITAAPLTVTIGDPVAK